MGATSFERMRRTRAAEDIMAMLAGHDLEEFRLQFSLPCEPTERGVQEALTSRTDYVELKERVEAWCGQQMLKDAADVVEERVDHPEPEPEAEPESEASAEPAPEPELEPAPAARPKGRPRRKGKI